MTGRDQNVMIEAYAAWNNAKLKASFAYANPRYGPYDYWVSDGNFGNDGYYVQLDNWLCNSGYLYGASEVDINVFNTDYIADGELQEVWVHGLGWLLGLGEENRWTSCNDIAAMNFDANLVYSVCHKNTPQADDKNGVNAFW